MKRVYMPINPAVLCWAREAIGYTQAEAADKVGVELDLFLAWENGTERPSYPQLRAIGKALKRVTPTFFLQTPPTDPKVPKDFRVLSGSESIKLAPSTLVEIRDAQRKREDALELATLLGESIKPFTWSATLESDINALGKLVRNTLGITEQVQRSFSSENNAFNTWRKAIEKQGVLVFQASLESLHEMRGLAIFHHHLPIILLNTKDDPKPRLFSLLHEFGHLLLGKSGIGNMNAFESRGNGYNKLEVFCNKFAAECLLPTDSFFHQLEVAAINPQHPPTKAIIAKLSNRYQVSWEAILRKLLDGQKLTQAFYQEFRSELPKFFADKKRKSKGGPLYQVRVYSNNGDPFTELALRSYGERKITAMELSRTLGLKLNLIQKMSPEYFGSGVT